MLLNKYTTPVSLLACLLLAACGDSGSDTSQPEKPAADPDGAITGKADILTNYYTTIAGELGEDTYVDSEIDYPDWFHGYTVEMDKGQELQFTLWASAQGIVRLYGPATGESYDGQPLFRRAVVRERATRNDDRYNSEFSFTAEEAGTYMVVYGPSYVWRAKYDISVKCLAGCSSDAGETSVEELLANPARYDGRTVTVTGHVHAGYGICTQAACSPANPCCNSCGASQGLYATAGDMQNSIALENEDGQFGCGGNNCDYMNNCTVEDGQYTITGVFTQGRYENSITVSDMNPIGDAGGECTDHDECENGWCRAIDWDNDSRECVPYVGEGENCGGFAPPQYINACSPELTCVFRPFIADAPGTCRNNVTVQELLENPDKWDGVRVNVDGYINLGFAACTRIACPQDDPCCNRCSAGQLLADAPGGDGGLRLQTGHTSFGCQGDSCNVAQECTIENSSGAYRVVGTFVNDGTRGYIEVEEHLSLEHF